MTNLLNYISMSGQRWGVAQAHLTAAIESADMHGLTKDFEPHVKDWRLGTAVLTRAADLYGSTDPVSNLAQKLDGENRIASIAKTGADVAHIFAADTVTPSGATHLLVYTQNNSVEAPSGVGVEMNG